MDEKHLKSLLEKFEESQKDKHRVYFSFFKSITTISVALIGLLIGLKVQPIPNPDARLAFLLSIILIGLCILFSLATRFYEVVAQNESVQVRKQHILKYIQNPKENKFQADQLNSKRVYKFFEISTFICLCLSVVSLILYVYFLDFH